MARPAPARAARWAACRFDAALARGRLGLANRISSGGHTRLQINNAVIGAPAESGFVALALEHALDVDPTVRFALGPNLLDDVAAALPSAVTVVPPSRFYAVPPGESYRYFDDATVELPLDAQVIHYVASNHRRLLDRLGPDDRRFDTGDAQFWKQARRVRATLERPHTGVEAER